MGVLSGLLKRNTRSLDYGSCTLGSRIFWHTKVTKVMHDLLLRYFTNRSPRQVKALLKACQTALGWQSKSPAQRSLTDTHGLGCRAWGLGFSV